MYYLPIHRDERFLVLGTVMNLRVPHRVAEVLNSCESTSFSVRSFLHGIVQLDLSVGVPWSAVEGGWPEGEIEGTGRVVSCCRKP
jgi:hypothetical protein